MLFVFYALDLQFSLSLRMRACVRACFRINHVEDHVENQTSGLNPDNLRSVHGKKLFENSQYLVQTHTFLLQHSGAQSIYMYCIKDVANDLFVFLAISGLPLDWIPTPGHFSGF